MTGGNRLSGEVAVGGAKNSVLKLMAAALLAEGTSTITNCPEILDVPLMAEVLRGLGANVELHDGTVHITAPDEPKYDADFAAVRQFRASVCVLGPLVGRCKRARVALPGGDAIGSRPLDMHQAGLRQLGAKCNIEHGCVVAEADHLRGAEIQLEFPSVGATENILMAASLAKGETLLVNAAREPEIADLARCLNAMGADISGAGSDRIRIRGVAKLHGADHSVIPDRIEIGTYMMAAAITGGSVELKGARHDLVAAVARVLEGAGVEVSETKDGLRVARGNRRISGVDVMTEPFPGFPTDLQAQMMALMSTADGAAMITETIFENRFMHVPELCRMGANINVHGASAMVRGVAHLTGAPVMATDLRASVSLVLAGLAAEGETVVNRVYHLDRGYERLEEKLAACGAAIERLPGDG